MADARLFKVKDKVYLKRKGRKVTLFAITKENKKAGITEVQEYSLRDVPASSKRISAAAFDRAIGDPEEDDFVFG